MTLNHVKLGFTFMKYQTDVVSLIFLPKALIWSKIIGLVINELTKNIRKNSPILLFLSDLSLLVVKISRAYN